MDEAIARAIHVIAVLLWIGGVAFVTTIVLPVIRRNREPADRMALFRAIEQRFAPQARVTTLLAGLSGLYMLFRLDLWDRFLTPSFWWMHAMVIVWLLFSAMLFVAEPLGLHRRDTGEPATRLARIERLHWVLLALSLITLFGAVAGSHGLPFF